VTEEQLHLPPHTGETPTDYHQRRLEILAGFGASEGYHAIMDIIEAREREILADLFGTEIQDADLRALHTRLLEVSWLRNTLTNATGKMKEIADREALGGVTRHVARQQALAKHADRMIAAGARRR
jgi:hypothetical protein